MKKKIITICLVVALALTAIGGATLAYFTDHDQVKNNFTIGNISIEVNEDNCYIWDDVAKEYVGKVTTEDGVTTFSGLMPTYIVDKRPYVENTSDTAAYVRVALTLNNNIAINEAIDDVYENKGYTEQDVQDVYDYIFYGWGLNHFHEGKDEGGRRMTMHQREDDRVVAIDSAFLMELGDYQFNRSNMFQAEVEIQDCINVSDWENDGVLDGYAGQIISDGYYYDALEPDSRVYVFYLYLEAGEKYYLFDQAANRNEDGGLNIPADFDNDQMKMFDGLEIGVYADAIQAAGFTRDIAGATKAFEALEAEHALGWWRD